MTARRTGLAVLVVALLLAACGKDEPKEAPPAFPRAATTAEAERLAGMRLKDHQAGTREVEVTFSVGGLDGRLSGWIDHVHHEGYVMAFEGGRPANLVVWGSRSIAIRALDVGEGELGKPPLPAPTAEQVAAAWQAGPLDPSQSTLHTILTVVLSLASDRADNPLLLQQGGVELVREDRIGDVPMSVFTGPRVDGGTKKSSLEYWIDGTGLLHRVDVQLPDGTTARIDEGATADVSLSLGLGDPPG